MVTVNLNPYFKWMETVDKGTITVGWATAKFFERYDEWNGTRIKVSILDVVFIHLGMQVNLKSNVKYYGNGPDDVTVTWNSKITITRPFKLVSRQ